jgi:multidrug efflux pump subunit AcrA (membrane-fusion protein)
MKNKNNKTTQEVLEYQPDAVEIEERPVPGSVRWVLYLLLGTLIAIVIGAVVFSVDRIVVAQGKLITTAPTIVIQSLNTAVIRSIEVQVGDIVEEGQLLATMDSTFASTDLTQLTKQAHILGAVIRRIRAELQQAKSEWQRFVEERSGELMEEEVKLYNEEQKIVEEINKAKRLHDLVSLRAPQQGIVLRMAELAVGSITRQAEPLITLVPVNSVIEVEVNVPSKDIARIRTDDAARVKLDAFPFQRHETLPGKVRVISEDSFRLNDRGEALEQSPSEAEDAFYRTRISLLSTQLRNVPAGFRLMPGMKVRAEIKVGKRSVISYFLYPIIRVFDESLREP